MGTGREDKVGGRCLPLLSPAFAGRAQGAWQMHRVWVDLLLLPPAFLVPEANHLASMWVPLPALLKPRVMTEVPGLPHQIERQLGHFLSLVPPGPSGLSNPFLGFFPPESCLGGRRITILCLPSPAPGNHYSPFCLYEPEDSTYFMEVESHIISPSASGLFH